MSQLLLHGITFVDQLDTKWDEILNMTIFKWNFFRSDSSNVAVENTSPEAIDCSGIVSVTVVNKDYETFVEYEPQLSRSLSEGWQLK